MDRERDSNTDWSAAKPSSPCNEIEKDVKLHIFENEMNKSFFLKISMTNYLPSNIWSFTSFSISLQGLEGQAVDQSV